MTRRVVVTGGASGRKFRFLERFLPALADKARIGFWQRLRSKIEG